MTIASSSGFRANGLIFFPSRIPSAYKAFWSSVSSFGDAEASRPEVCAQAIIEQKQKESVRKWTVFFIIGNQNTSFRLLSKARRILCPGEGHRTCQVPVLSGRPSSAPQSRKILVPHPLRCGRIKFRLARRVRVHPCPSVVKSLSSAPPNLRQLRSHDLQARHGRVVNNQAIFIH